jgi:hypothetical protein
MAAAQGRVAVVGGGLAGCLGALILRSRGLRPTIFDAGRRSPGGRLLGGRQPDSGVQFLRASEPRFAAIMHMLAGEGLVAPWRGRFGLLGSQGGGFLPADTLASTPIGSMMREATSEGGGGGGSVDFCGFVGGMKEHPAYVGTPSNACVHGESNMRPSRGAHGLEHARFFASRAVCAAACCRAFVRRRASKWSSAPR